MTRDISRFRVSLPPIAVGANKVMFDVFNAADSGLYLVLSSALIVPNRDTGVTGVVSARFSLTRTSTIGTGGTAATAEGTNPTAPTVARVDNAGIALPTGITVRSATAGGATAGAVISTRQVFTEETSPASWDVAFSSPYESSEIIICAPGSGFRVVQGTVASVGSVGFELLIATR